MKLGGTGFTANLDGWRHNSYPGIRMSQSIDEIRRGYDRSARNYAAKFRNELDGKPFDRELLTEFAAGLTDRPHLAIDLGCGTGQTTAFVADQGLTVTGIDLSPGMIVEAKAGFPDVPFDVGDMFRLNRTDESVDGIIAFYAIVNNSSEDLSGLFAEWARVLRHDGKVVLAFHDGEGVVVQEDFIEAGARLVFHYHCAELVAEQLESAGLSVNQTTIREPYPSEYPSRRAYLLATKYKK